MLLACFIVQRHILLHMLQHHIIGYGYFHPFKGIDQQFGNVE